MINREIKLILTVGYWLITYGYCSSQDTLDNSIRQKLENLAESSQNEEADYSNLLQNLDYYKKHQINLNNANKEQLLELGLLDEIRIENLLSHIDKSGKLISVYELQSIEGFDTQTIEKILPYIKVSDITEDTRASLKEIIKHGNQDLVIREQRVLEKQKGFSPADSAEISKSPNSRYIGSPDKIYARYQFSYENKVSAGITAEKDPGELFFKKNSRFNYPNYNSLLNGKQKNGFDFYSAHLFIRNIGFIKTLAIGDYLIGFGQGLTTWSGLAYGKNADVMTIGKNATGIRPYTSADENRFMRGCAITAGTGNIRATGFFSRKKVDANISVTDSSNNTVAITSLQETGLHTTPAEIADKDAITQTVAGGNISYRKRKYSFGITGVHTVFDASINPSPELYNQFSFRGKELTNFGADYSFLIRNFNFFGEMCSSIPNINQTGIQEAGFAFLNGCNISLDPRLSFSVLYRSFQRNFHNFFSNAFAENSTTSNEQGLYFGINTRPSHAITINAYYDRFNFPWLKYQVSAPSNGNEFLFQISYDPSKRFSTYLKIKKKDKFINDNYVNTDATEETDAITAYTQTNYRWNITYKISRSITLGNRVEYLAIKKPTMEDGYLIYQDATYKKIGSKFSFTLRYALFDTKSYNSRIYAYEDDIPGSYSIPSYYNKGNRVYVMLYYSVSRKIELWLRCSQTYYSNQNIISSGSLNEIDGHSKSELKVQMRIKF